jgi:serine/threonine-protein kinase
VVEKIGSGGMGEVYKTIDLRLNTTVAVKVRTLNNPESHRAFQREAQFLSNLRHPSLPSVKDYFVKDETQYLVMEYIEGEDLKQQLQRRQKSFSVGEVLDWTKQLLNVLFFLHKEGVQHRDIKPANIKIRNGRLFLLDFSIAYGQVGEMSTMSSRSFSWNSYTPDFAPLEQINGEKTSPASDLYALAGTIYYLLTGVKPESAAYRIQVMALDKKDPLKDIRFHLPNLNPDVASAIMSALQLNMDERPQSVEEVYRAMFPEKSAPAKSRARHALAASALATLIFAGVAAGTMIPIFRAGICSSGQQDFLSNLFRCAAPDVLEVTQDNKITLREESEKLATGALVLLQSGRYEDAITKSKEAIAKDSDNVFARFVYGDAIWDTYYDDVESYDEMTIVQEQADRILELVAAPQTSREYTARGWANLVKEKYDVAIADATKALESDPDSVAALMVRASAKSFIPDEDNRQILSAFDDFDSVIQLMPNYVQARANRANAYLKLGKIEWAISDFSEAIRIMPAARYFNGRGNAYYSLGKYPEARQEYQEALKLNNRFLSAQVSLADTYFKEEDWKNAVKHYTKAISIKPTFEVLRSRGFTYGCLKKFDKATEDFTEAIKINENDYLVYQYRAMVFCALSEWKKAIPDLSKAIENTPKNARETLAELYRSRAMVYGELGNREKAKADEQKASLLAS